MDPPCYNYLNIFLFLTSSGQNKELRLRFTSDIYSSLRDLLAVAIKRLVNSFPIKSFGQLVLLSFAITDFTPAAYLRRSLRRPFNGYLILRKASYLDAFSTYPIQT